ncbi:retrovirus-related pol polyprotein from transposon TNT 1-94 [Tanacetum coccineum]
MHHHQVNLKTTPEYQPPVIPNDVKKDNHDIEVAHMGNDPLLGIPIPEVPSDQSSSSDSIHTNLGVSTRLQFLEQKLFSVTYDCFLTFVEPLIRIKMDLTQASVIEAMQEELNEFERLEVWELVPRPDKVMVITLKWIYKVKLDELGGILKNKARLVARGYHQEEGIDFEESFASVGPRLEFFLSIWDGSYRTWSSPNGCDDCVQWIATLFITQRDGKETLLGSAYEKALNALKRIFRYLMELNRGLWYPKDSLIALTAFADADHAGCQDTRRSTSGSMQFLGDRLISWSSKRQKSAAISSMEAEYIALFRALCSKSFG